MNTTIADYILTHHAGFALKPAVFWCHTISMDRMEGQNDERTYCQGQCRLLATKYTRPSLHPKMASYSVEVVDPEPLRNTPNRGWLVREVEKQDGMRGVSSAIDIEVTTASEGTWCSCDK
jgi:hypothetical protein